MVINIKYQMRSVGAPCVAGAWGKLPHLPPPRWAALRDCSGSTLLLVGRWSSLSRSVSSNVSRTMIRLMPMKERGDMIGLVIVGDNLLRLSSLIVWHTEHRGWVVDTPVSYAVGPGFKSQPGYRLSWLSFLWFSSVPPGKYLCSTLN
jgi:hypothetical protein